jgi:predicted alpha/beta superfamily hydrolase
VRSILEAASLPLGSPVAIFGNPSDFGRRFTMSPALWTKDRGLAGEYSAYPVSNLFVMPGKASHIYQ